MDNMDNTKNNKYIIATVKKKYAPMSQLLTKKLQCVVKNELSTNKITSTSIEKKLKKKEVKLHTNYTQSSLPYDIEDINTINEKSQVVTEKKELTHETISSTSIKKKLEKAQAKLHTNYTPSSVPCRDEEFNEIFRFLKLNLKMNTSASLYVSGTPGTGKTTIINEVVRCLKTLETRGELNKFDYISINGLALTEPRQAYVKILNQLTGEKTSCEKSREKLNIMFTGINDKKTMKLLLVDELDKLLNRKQDVLYDIFNWTQMKSSRLIVVSISNAINLPETILKHKITSRFGITRVSFKPYNYRQLQDIIKGRLRRTDIFESEAIELLSRKVAALSGDARRALNICRRATEIAEYNKSNKITITDVKDALNQMINSPVTRAIESCSIMEKYFLKSIVAEIRRTGVESVSFMKVYEQLVYFCSLMKLETPNITQALSICRKLFESRLIYCIDTDIVTVISLYVSPDDVDTTIKMI